MQSTSPDTLLFCPTMTSYVEALRVDQSGYVAGHHPLTAELRLPSKPPSKMTWRLPESWIPYCPSTDLLGQCYEQQSADPGLLQQAAQGPTLALKEWSMKIEQAVDMAIRAEHHQHPERQPYSALPKKQRDVVNCLNSLRSLNNEPSRKLGNGHYNPELNTGPLRLRQQIRQLRRVQSLKQRVGKLATLVPIWPDTLRQPAEEWNAVIQAAGYPGGFLRWTSHRPELQHISRHFPDYEALHDIEQLLRYDIKQLEIATLHQQKQLTQYRRWFDKKHGHHKQSYQAIREPGHGCLTTLQTEHSTLAYDIQDNRTGLLQMQLQDDLPLRPDLPLFLDNRQVQLISYHHPAIEVMAMDVEEPFSATANRTQKCDTAEPNLVGRALANYWNRYWQRDTPQEQQDESFWSSFQQILDTLPEQAECQFDLWQLDLWKDAIHSLKSHTARGICGFYADELKQIAKVDFILTDFITICRNVVSFPSWFMLCKVSPVAKAYDSQRPNQIRPITVLALLYRVWGKAMSRGVIRHWSSTFLPGRSAESYLYHLQFQLRCIHGNLTSASLGGLDLVKAFNQLPRMPGYMAMKKLGIPDQILQVWFNSLQFVQRYWSIDGHLVPSGMSTTGVPEGDALSVISMLSINRLWGHHGMQKAFNLVHSQTIGPTHLPRQVFMLVQYIERLTSQKAYG